MIAERVNERILRQVQILCSVCDLSCLKAHTGFISKDSGKKNNKVYLEMSKDSVH